METLKNNYDSNEQLKILIHLAQINDGKSWEEIDKELPKYSEDLVFFNWARNNTTNEDAGLRDLAASILESSTIQFNDTDIFNLLTLMREKDAENPYPSFRATCALAKKIDPKKYKKLLNEIKDKLEGFIENKNVLNIAKQYLEKI